MFVVLQFSKLASYLMYTTIMIYILIKSTLNITIYIVLHLIGKLISYNCCYAYVTIIAR